MVEEGDTRYNAGVISALQDELLGPVEKQRLGRSPQWSRVLVAGLLRRIANLRARVHELEKERS